VNIRGVWLKYSTHIVATIVLVTAVWAFVNAYGAYRFAKTFLFNDERLHLAIGKPKKIDVRLLEGFRVDTNYNANSGSYFYFSYVTARTKRLLRVELDFLDKWKVTKVVQKVGSGQLVIDYSGKQTTTVTR